MEILILIGLIILVSYFVNKSGSSNNYKPKINNTSYKSPLASDIPVKTQLNVKKMEVSNISLSSEQQAVFKIINTTKENVYITGKAGTGKSVLLQYFVEHTGKSVAVVAPTGVAALNVGGQTIHSFFKFGLDVLEGKDIKIDYKTKEILRHVDAIVIDEVSMVRVDLMEAINIKLQLAYGNNLPFGGVQLILFGDLYQLPPVVSDGQLHRYFNHTYGGIYFFNAPVFKNTKLNVYELQYIFRQKDSEFKDLLNSIRNGDRSDSILTKVNNRFSASVPDNGIITLAGTNATVSSINQLKLTELPDSEYIYTAEISGDIQQSSFPTEKELRLKVGAQVMMLKNDRMKPPRWVNGTLGIVTKLSSDTIRVNIDGVEHSVSKETWNKIRYYYDHTTQKLEKEVVSSFTQFPIRLAWAITIHKSQGQTYQTVAINLSDGAFAHGQTYVALSRCQSFEGLYLTKPIKPEDIIIDQEIINFMSHVEIIN